MSIYDTNSIYGSFANGMTYTTPKDYTWTNPLTPEEEKVLHRGGSGFSLDIPKEDMYRAKCTHRDPNSKKFTVKPNADGTYTCLKCGATFNIVDNLPVDEIKKIIGATIDILQTTKLSYIDMTPDAINSYFIILPFLEILPQLYEAAMHTLHNAGTSMGVGPNTVSGDAFSSLYSAVGNMGGMNPAMYNQMMQMMQQMMANQAQAGKFMTPPTETVPFNMNPMQTQAPAMTVMPGAADVTSTATATTAQPQEGQPVQVSKKFDLN